MNRAKGFTLLELVLVIVITGVMAAAIAVFVKPAVDAYFDTRRRAELSDAADTARTFDHLAALLEPIDRAEVLVRGAETGFRLAVRVRPVRPLK